MVRKGLKGFGGYTSVNGGLGCIKICQDRFRGILRDPRGFRFVLGGFIGEIGDGQSDPLKDPNQCNKRVNSGSFSERDGSPVRMPL